MIYHTRIDYDEGDPGSYRGVVVTKGGSSAPVFEARSGDPGEDWKSYQTFAASKNADAIFMHGSNLTHFVQDVPGWRFVIDESGQEALVADPDDERLDPNYVEPF